MTSRHRTLAAACSLGLLFGAPLRADEPATKPKYAGQQADAFLLPNGWKLTPAGRQVPLADLPLNIIPLSATTALVATSGYNTHDLALVDLEAAQKIDAQTVRESWFGLVVSPQRDRVFWSGGGTNVLHAFALADGKLAAQPPLAADPSAGAGELAKLKKRFKSGLAIDAARGRLYSLDIQAGTLTETDLAGQRPGRTVVLGGRPYDVAVGRSGTLLYVSDWARRAVVAIEPDELRVVARIGTGEHPNQLALHPADDRLFVACASSNQVAVIDTRRGIVTETIFTALFPRAPEGSTPDALAVAPDGRTLYVANADNNCIAVIDVERPNHSDVQGFIPTGWYPTAVATTPDGKRLLVGVGKGNATQANPVTSERNPTGDDVEAQAVRAGLPFAHPGNTLSGALSIVDVPGAEELAAYTDRVYRNCPYSDEQLSAAPHPERTAIPTKVGEPSPIKHVFYIIKENRTYDQVFGDLAQGNGDPSLVMFGRQITPNQHKLVEQFVLLDNTYCNGHVSADGHPWSTMAYNTDYTARNWALGYSSRADIDDDEEENLSRAPSGYLWDACARAGISYRSYGEYGHRVSQPDGSLRMEGAVPGLVGHMSPRYGGFGQRDTDNLAEFLAEFREFEKHDNLPQFIIMSLGEDHTHGTSPGKPTPQACVANHDLALGQLVEAISHSKYWPTSAIFVIEDDAQNGADHVDAHRTVALVISPYAKRKTVDSTQYATVSLIRTMELILGLAPLSQFDAAARPMFASFTAEPDLTPYTHEPARIDVNALNNKLAYGAERSARMNFAEADKIDDFELNEILWRAVKGPDAPLPPAVRRAIAYRPAPGE